MAKPISEIVTHVEPHIDEMGCVCTARIAGEKFFRGISEAVVTPHIPSIHDDGRSEEEWEQDGVIFIGVRGGRFDDHPHEDFPEDCAFSRFIKYIGLYDSCPSWQWLSREILDEDRHGTKGKKDHLAQIVKNLNRFHPVETVEAIVQPIMGCLQQYYIDTDGEPEQYKGLCFPVIDTALRRYNDSSVVDALEAPIYDAFERVQESFRDAVEFLSRHGRVEDVLNTKTGRTLRLVVARSNNRDISSAARWKEGYNADMVVQFTPHAHGDMVYISASKPTGFTSLRWLANKLRYLEQKFDAELAHIGEFSRLSQDGLVNRWYHHLNAKALYASTPTHPNEKRTKLYRRRIIKAAKEFLADCELYEKRRTYTAA